ncbi:hypothetical protein GCM10010469_17210 [Streptomyces labedae]|uniref:Protein kinase domain-containing protein n=1 Tax=Streptomyces labedae TaxID=285569 RepID=A0ABP6QTE9_9ACTN
MLQEVTDPEPLRVVHGQLIDLLRLDEPQLRGLVRDREPASDHTGGEADVELSAHFTVRVGDDIARSVLATGEAEPTQEADIYGLGASLLISATGLRAMEYPDDAPRPVQREAVANGKRRPVKAPGPLGELIDAMLSYTPEDRPTIYEVGNALT